MITVAFRYDDYASTSDADVERRVLDAFRQNRIAVTYGVIPCICAKDPTDPAPQLGVPLTAQQAALLAEPVAAGCVEVALHGYSHQARSVDRLSEFSGLPCGEQTARIRDGKQLLQTLFATDVNTFIPPFSDYDANTVRGLERCGVELLSASNSWGRERASALKYLPATCTLPRLHDAITVARQSACPSPLIVVVFHKYEVREFDPARGTMTHDEFRRFLEWTSAQPDVVSRTLRDAGAENEDLSLTRYRRFCAARGHRGVYWEAARLGQLTTNKRQQSRKRRLAVGLLVAAFALIVVIVLALSHRIAFSNHAPEQDRSSTGSGQPQ